MAAPEVDVGRGQIAETLVISAMIVMIDEGCDLGLKVLREVIIFQQNAVLERLVPALDLALGLRMTRRTTDVLDISSPQPFCQIARDVTRAVIGQQARLVSDFS